MSLIFEERQQYWQLNLEVWAGSRGHTVNFVGIFENFAFSNFGRKTNPAKETFCKIVLISRRYGKNKIDLRLHKKSWRLTSEDCYFGISCSIPTNYLRLENRKSLLSNRKNRKQLWQVGFAICHDEHTTADRSTRWQHSFQSDRTQNDADWTYGPFLVSRLGSWCKNSPDTDLLKCTKLAASLVRKRFQNCAL